jgi:preprotein translocase subunit SecA
LMRVEVMFNNPDEQQPESSGSFGGQSELSAAPTYIAEQIVDPANRDVNDPATWGKVGRNEACPCGSGKKYKHCHGALAVEV